LHVATQEEPIEEDESRDEEYLREAMRNSEFYDEENFSIL